MNIVTFNIFIFGITFLFFYKFNRSNKVLLYSTGIYLFSAIGGIILYNSHQTTYLRLSYYGSIIFYLFFMFSIIPLYNINYAKVNKIETNDKFLDTLSKVIFYCSIIPFLSSLWDMRILFTGDIANYLTDVHDERHVQLGTALVSQIPSLLIKVAYYSQAFLPLLLFYNINKYKKFNKCCWGIILSQFSIAISSLLRSSRSPLIDLILTYGFAYFMLYGKFDPKTNRLVKKVVIYFAGIVASFLMIVTLGRYIGGTVDNSNVSVWEWLSVYSSEGMLNFNEDYVHENTKWGQATVFYYLAPRKEQIETETSTYMELTTYWNQLTGHSTNTFMTSFGAFVHAYGLEESLIGVLLFSIFFTMLMRKIKRRFSGMALFTLIGKYIIYGFMGFYYSNKDGNNLFFQGLIMVMIIYFAESKTSNKKNRTVKKNIEKNENSCTIDLP